MAIPPDQLLQTYAPPLSQNWTRRAYHGSILVGDWIYIHMGEVAVGTVPFSDNILDPHYVPYPVNGTLSLHIGSSWSDPRNVSFQAFPKPKSAIYCFGSLWYDEKKNEVFSFGGEESYLDGDNPPAPFADLSTYKLLPTSDGYGTWTQNASDTTVPFTQPGITRPFGGASAQSNTTAFYLGGYASSRSSDKTKFLTTFVPTPGLITYDFATGAWANETQDSTLAIDNPMGPFEWGGMEYLPKLGPNGMLVVFGGDTSNSSIYVQGEQKRHMNNIALYDPITKTWYNQQIPGTAPSDRSRFCSVSVSDSRATGNSSVGTHDIFIYGGYASVFGQGAEQYDEVWVLSLPAFTWQLLDSTHATGRIGHTCHLVGKRQLLSIGGADASIVDTWLAPDNTNWNGLGVFDLTNASWSSGYNANAEEYQRPKAVQDYYDANGPYPGTWTQSTLQKLIQGNNLPNTKALQVNSSAISSPPPVASPSSNVSIPASNTSPASSPTVIPFHTSTSRSGVIAGATIGGAIAAALPFFLLYFFFFRRRSHHEGAEINELPGDYAAREELYGGTIFKGNRGPSQAPRTRDASRAYSKSRSRGRSRSRRLVAELDAGDAVNELGRPTPTASKRTGDYFGLLRPSRPIAKLPKLVTTGVHEAPTMITPAIKRGGVGDYFGSIKRPRGGTTPKLVTPGVKEVSGLMTPRWREEEGKRQPLVRQQSGPGPRPPVRPSLMRSLSRLPNGERVWDGRA